MRQDDHPPVLWTGSTTRRCRVLLRLPRRPRWCTLGALDSEESLGACSSRCAKRARRSVVGMNAARSRLAALRVGFIAAWPAPARLQQARSTASVHHPASLDVFVFAVSGLTCGGRHPRCRLLRGPQYFGPTALHLKNLTCSPRAGVLFLLLFLPVARRASTAYAIASSAPSPSRGSRYRAWCDRR